MGTRGGLVHDVVYDDICIRNSGRPLDITAAYAANGPVKGTSPPTFRDITLHNVSISGGGKILFDGYDHDHRAQVLLDGVYLTDAAPYTYTFDNADVTVGAGGTNLNPGTGTDATLHRQTHPAHQARHLRRALRSLPHQLTTAGHAAESAA